MKALTYSPFQRLAGGLAGWIACLALKALFQLPDAVLLALFAGIAAVVRRIAGDSPATRAVEDLHFIFSRGGEAAAVIKRLILESRNEEVVGVVRGAVIRSLS